MSRTILVCQHETCPRQGATAVLKAFKSQTPSDVVVQSAGCLGECGSGPMVVVLPEEIWYCHVEVKDVPKIVEQHLRGGKPAPGETLPQVSSSKAIPQNLVDCSSDIPGILGLIILVNCQSNLFFLRKRTAYKLTEINSPAFSLV